VSGIALAYSLPHLPWLGRHIDRRDHAASAQVAFRFNSFIGLALAERLAGAQGLLLIAVLIGVCVPLFNTGAVWPMARHGAARLRARAGAQPADHRHRHGAGGQPAGFFHAVLAGAHRHAHWRGVAGAGPDGRRCGHAVQHAGRGKTLAVAVLGIKHIAMPLMALGCALLFRLDFMQTTVLLAFSALPTASSCYVLAARMGYNGAYVAGLVTLSTLLGMVSLPFALGVLR
jgi:malonate transporter